VTILEKEISITTMITVVMTEAMIIVVQQATIQEARGDKMCIATRTETITRKTLDFRYLTYWATRMNRITSKDQWIYSKGKTAMMSQIMVTLITIKSTNMNVKICTIIKINGPTGNRVEA
jgi:hypothetical protein